MRHIKIKTKLLLSFALVSVLAITVGVIGTIGITSIEGQYNDTLNLSNDGISSMADIRELYQMQRLMLHGMMLDIDSPEQVQSRIKQLREYEAQMAEAMSRYESSIVDPTKEERYFSAKQLYTTMFKTAKENFINAAQSGDYELSLAAHRKGGETAAPIMEGLQGTVKYIQGQSGAMASEMSSYSHGIIAVQVVAIISSTMFAIALGLYLAALIGNPIKTMSSFFSRFGATGDLTLSDEDQKNIDKTVENRDEIGLCIAAANKMVVHIMNINNSLTQLASGDLTADVEVLSEKDTLGLSVSKMVENISALFGEIRSASAQVSSGAEQISQGAQELASGASQQAASIEEFSATLVDMKEKTRKNADNSVLAQDVNSQAGKRLEDSIRSMSEMLEAMKDIDEGSKSITKIIKVIDDIAFQTNILALNAAVEAARAGQHGKGFAVVADEVRNLASKSADAAKETAALIEGSSEKVREGNQIVHRTNSSLIEVAAGAKEAISLLQGVAAGSKEQARAIEEMNQSIEQISGVVQENSASAEESAAASEEMSSQAVMLEEIVSRFKVKPSERVNKPAQPERLSHTSGIALSRRNGEDQRQMKY